MFEEWVSSQTALGCPVCNGPCGPVVLSCGETTTYFVEVNPLRPWQLVASIFALLVTG